MFVQRLHKLSKLVNGADLEQARDLRRQGYSIRMLAARMGIAPELLAKLLGETLHK